MKILKLLAISCLILSGFAVDFAQLIKFTTQGLAGQPVTYSSSSSVPEGQYIISNKEYPYANYMQFSNINFSDEGTYINSGTLEGGFNSLKLWVIEEAKGENGYYTISNYFFDSFRIAKWNIGLRTTGVVNGNYDDSQYWKFVQDGDYYHIINKKYNCRLVKWGDGPWDNDCTYGEYNDNELWKVTSRYSVKTEKIQIWHADNREGSQDFSEQVKLYSGFKQSNTNSEEKSFGFKESITQSFKASIGIDIPVIGNIGGESSEEITTDFTQQFTSTVTNSYTTFEETTRTITFTAPAGKEYTVWQLQSPFEDLLDSASFTFKGTSYYIEESD